MNRRPYIKNIGKALHILTHLEPLQSDEGRVQNQASKRLYPGHCKQFWTIFWHNLITRQQATVSISAMIRPLTSPESASKMKTTPPTYDFFP